MPKPELKDKIAEWLNTQGYPLEMKVAAALRKKGFEVIQSFYYEDENEGKLREIDVVASKHLLNCIIYFVIECKKSSKNHWILFSSGDIIDQFDANSMFCYMSEGARSLLYDYDIDGVELESIPWHNKNGRIAYSAADFNKDKNANGATYKAIMSVSNASQFIEYINIKDTINPVNSRPKQKECFIFPVIIFEGKLFECFLQNNTTELEEIYEAFYFHSPQLKYKSGTYIRILSADRLEKFCEEADQIYNKLYSIMGQHKVNRVKGVLKYLEEDGQLSNNEEVE